VRLQASVLHPSGAALSASCGVAALTGCLHQRLSEFASCATTPRGSLLDMCNLESRTFCDSVARGRRLIFFLRPLRRLEPFLPRRPLNDWPRSAALAEWPKEDCVPVRLWATEEVVCLGLSFEIRIDSARESAFLFSFLCGTL